jgi:hypothetical protein
MAPAPQYSINPLCHLIPVLQEDELNGLAEDIGRRGLLEAIFVLLDGKVRDGRNRREACRRAGVEPHVVNFEGDDSPLEWGIAKNLRRRQFNASQRAVIALTVLPLMEPEAREQMRQSEGRGKKGAQYCAPFLEGDSPPRQRAVDEAARLLGASPRYIQAAKKVRRFHIVQGTINLVDARTAGRSLPANRGARSTRSS